MGLDSNLDLYPAFSVFVMFQMEIFTNGGYLTNDIGLDKVFTEKRIRSRTTMPTIVTDNRNVGSYIFCQ